MKYLTIVNEDFGPLLPFIVDANITDINWNGKDLWIDDVEKGRYLIPVKLDNKFISVFCQKISNAVNENFNKYYPLLEAETDNLRISIVHETVTNTGYSISIRKTPPIRKISKETIESGYCDDELDVFMQSCVKAGISIIVCGIPGTGKTEYIKYLTQYIDKKQRVITVEDNLELRYSLINPNHDCVELKVDSDFSYGQAIKTSLRQRPDWIVLSEARSREVQFLIESGSVGTGCMTTIHTDRATNIPDRIMNMLGTNSLDKENNIYTFFQVGVLIVKKELNGKIIRKVQEVCLFDREDGQNKIKVLYRDGLFLSRKIPISIVRKFKQHSIENPLNKKKGKIEGVD